MSSHGNHSQWYHRVFRAPTFPDEMRAVTRIDSAEVRPAEAGLSSSAVYDVWNAVKSLYLTNMHPGVAFCLRRQGKMVLNRSLGYARGLLPEEQGPPVPLTLDTPICLFSASKAIAAMVVHKLAEDGHVDLLNPVSYYIPPFAQKGKGHITIHQLLSHRGGVPLLEGEPEPEALIDTERMLRIVCASEPSCTEGRMMQYHAVTGGFLIAELVRVTTGMTFKAYLNRHFRQPLGMRFFDYGLDEADSDRVATNYVTGLPTGKMIGEILERVLGSNPDVVTPLTNETAFKRAVIPSANLFATAEEACRFYQMLLDRGMYAGRQVLDPLTIFHATRESGKTGVDQLLKLPLRYSSGFMLGGRPYGMYGGQTHYAFGHAGYSNVVCWADPERDIAAALLTTGKPIVGPQLLHVPRLLATISRCCEPVRDFAHGDLLYGNAHYGGDAS